MSVMGRIIAGARELSLGGPLGNLLDRVARHLPRLMRWFLVRSYRARPEPRT